MMKSVFTPIPAEKQQLSKTLKVSTTRQDWCGHVYLQYNLEDDQYKVKQYSYFEKEGNRTVMVPYHQYTWKMESGHAYELHLKLFH